MRLSFHLRFLKKIQSDKKGFSVITQVLVVAGLIGIISLGAMGLFSSGTKGQKVLQAQDDARVLTNGISSILESSIACLTNFSSKNPIVGLPVTDIKDESTVAQFAVGSIYGNRTLKLSAMSLGGPGIDLRSGLSKWVQTGSNPKAGTVVLQLDWLQTGAAVNQTSGPQLLHRYVLLYVTLDALDKITFCRSIASTNTGTIVTPSGSSSQVQYNQSGSFAADSGFLYAGLGAVSVSGAAYNAIYAATTAQGKGLSGWGNATVGANYGIFGSSESNSGHGIAGINTRAGYGAYFSSSSGPALITGTGNVGIGVPSPQAALDIKGGLRLRGSSSGYSELRSPAAAGNVTWTLPTADGSAGQVLKTDGNGNLYWSSVAPPLACSGQTNYLLSHCDLSPVSSGQTSGQCSASYIGACSYRCSNGVWGSPGPNTCTCNISPGSITYSIPNTYSFPLPTCFNSLTVEAWGAGGGGQSAGIWYGTPVVYGGGAGGDSSFGTLVIAHGGNGLYAGSGTGGTTNLTGENGNWNGWNCPGLGGAGANGGGRSGAFPGGGGDGFCNGWGANGGGGGGYSSKTFGPGAIPGTSVTVKVGAGGSDRGAAGQVKIRWQ